MNKIYQFHFFSFREKGFTLIELLVVVLIIGVLSVIAFPQYQKAVLKARVQRHLIWLRSIALAQEVYYMENADYARTFAELSIQLPKGTKEEIRSDGDYIFYEDGWCTLGYHAASNSHLCTCTLPTFGLLRVVFAHSPGNPYKPKNAMHCSDSTNSLMEQVCVNMGFEKKAGGGALFLF